MQRPAPIPDGRTVLEVDAQPSVCLVPGCGGAVVRHSLGGGVAIHRCTRCFRRYQLRPDAAAAPKGRFRRMLDEFVTWQDR
jgi:hypothetical protein